MRNITLDKLLVLRYNRKQQAAEPINSTEDMQAHSPSLQPVVKVTHQMFKRFLAAQPWSYWAIDTSVLEPLRLYYPVSIETLVRVLKSHYTYSDVYIFCHTSSEADIAQIDWKRIPLLASDRLTAYVITSAPCEPFLGFAGALHTALAGEIITLFPATTTDRLTIEHPARVARPDECA